MDKNVDRRGPAHRVCLAPTSIEPQFMAMDVRNSDVHIGQARRALGWVAESVSLAGCRRLAP